MMRSHDEFGAADRAVSRRDLFRLRTFCPSTVPESASAEIARSTGYDLINASRPAMGSYFEVRIPVAIAGAAELATRALDVVDDLEAQLTIYRDDSEVAQLNASAHLGPIPVEKELFDLLKRAVELWRATDGAYDVTSGALSLAWGFTKGPKRVPDAVSLIEARKCTGSQHLRLDRRARTVAFDVPGLKINLGSIGKGYAIDRAAQVVRDHWYPSPALIHGGRSSLYAIGSPPDQFGGRWEIAVRNPLDPEASVGSVRLRNRGMGTSGAAFQQFEANGRVYGHVIDPRTGEPPQDGPLSVTVLAPTAAEADALSTAFYLIGPEATAAYVAGHPEVGVIFLIEGNDSSCPDILTWGLSDADFRVASASTGRSTF